MYIENWLTFRVQRVRKEKLKNRSIYEILGKLNQMDNRLSMLRDQKLKKMRKQKDKVRNYSLQVNISYFSSLNLLKHLHQNLNSNPPRFQ